MPLRLLCITAHPDDESGGFAGALLSAHEAGVQTAVLCLTAGASGSYRAPGQSDADLAAVRAQEFASACRRLNVEEAVLLDYPDGGLWQQPFLSLAAVLTGHVRRLQPHIVLTFGAEGGVNQHRDHTMLSLAATAAFHWAPHTERIPATDAAPWAPQKLYYLATSFISSQDEYLRRVATRTPAMLRIEVDQLHEKKVEAFRCHESQSRLLDRVLADFPDALREEAYLLAAARKPCMVETTLWEGVEPDDLNA